MSLLDYNWTTPDGLWMAQRACRTQNPNIAATYFLKEPTMRTNGQTPRIIFALNQPSQADDVRLIHNAGIEHFKIGKGFYKGKHENVYSCSLEHLSKLRQFLKSSGQESVLLLDNQGNAFLSPGPDYPNYAVGGCEYVGEMRQVDVTVASKSDAWSQFEGVYYVAR